MSKLRFRRTCFGTTYTVITRLEVNAIDAQHFIAMQLLGNMIALGFINWHVWVYHVTGSNVEYRLYVK